MTSRPRCCRCSAMPTPTMPAPSTSTSALSSPTRALRKLQVTHPRRTPRVKLAVGAHRRKSARLRAKTRLRASRTLWHIGCITGDIAECKRPFAEEAYTNVGSSHPVGSERLGHRVHDVPGIQPDPALCEPGRAQVTGSLHPEGNDDDRSPRPCL